MRILDPRLVLCLATAFASSLALTGCGDNDDNPPEGPGGASNSGGGNNGSGGGKDGSGGGNDGSGGGNDGTGGGNDGSGGGNNADEYPALPAAFAVSGCANGPGPLCSVSQDQGNFTANCGGVEYKGTVSKAGAVSFSSPEITVPVDVKAKFECKGQLSNGSLSNASCTRSTNDGAAPTTCELSTATQLFPSLTCLDLPSKWSDFKISQGSNVGLQAASCEVIQNACSFQASCGESTLAGTVTATGITFTQSLKALAASAAEVTPAFASGAQVNHSCSATLSGSNWSGNCSAGGRNAGRGTAAIPHTSVYDIQGKSSEAPATCGVVAPDVETLFALNSCNQLKSQIGEPVCAYRQKGCIWEVDCGDNLVFQGRTDSSNKIEWALENGSECQGSFDAQGNFSGKCDLGGQSCNLESVEAVPGGNECATLPVGQNFYSSGCAGGDPLDCRVTMQHGCNFAAICAFSSRYPSLVFSGSVSKGTSGRDRMEFNGIGNYECYVERATDEDIASDPHRKEGEWFGQCENENGGLCRDNFNPDTGSGFRGLRLFFE